MVSEPNTRLRFTASLNAFVFSGAQALLIALYPFLAVHLNLSLSAIIGSFSLGSFLFLIGSPFWANTSDSIGRIKTLRIGMLALFISFGLLVFLVHTSWTEKLIGFYILILSRIIYGLIASSLAPVAQTLQADLIADAPKSHLMTKAMTLHTLSLNLGRVFGLALLVLFKERIFLVLVTFLVLILATLLFNLITENKSSINNSISENKNSWKADFLDMKMVFLTAFVFTCFVEALNSSLGGSIKNIFHLDPVVTAHWTASLLLAASIGIVLVQSIVRLLPVQIAGSSAILSLGTVSLIGGALVLSNIYSEMTLWFSIILFVIGIGIVPPFYLSALRRENSQEKIRHGRRAGLIGSAHTLGYACGATISAISFYLGAPHSGLALCLVGLVLYFLCARLVSKSELFLTKAKS